MDFIIKNSWFLLFVAWGLPLSYYRSKFRKIVYQTDSWIINIKPVFWKELKGLFGNIYPDNKKYKRFRNFYIFYLAIYFILFFTPGSFCGFLLLFLSSISAFYPSSPFLVQQTWPIIL